MALSPEEIATGTRVSIKAAQEVLKANPNTFVIWRPDESLPEEHQYAVIIE